MKIATLKRLSNIVHVHIWKEEEEKKRERNSKILNHTNYTYMSHLFKEYFNWWIFSELSVNMNCLFLHYIRTQEKSCLIWLFDAYYYLQFNFNNFLCLTCNPTNVPIISFLFYFQFLNHFGLFSNKTYDTRILISKT